MIPPRAITCLELYSYDDSDVSNDHILFSNDGDIVMVDSNIYCAYDGYIFLGSIFMC
jgi:hypothetical protein